MENTRKQPSKHVTKVIPAITPPIPKWCVTYDEIRDVCKDDWGIGDEGLTTEQEKEILDGFDEYVDDHTATFDDMASVAQQKLINYIASSCEHDGAACAECTEARIMEVLAFYVCK